MFGRNHTTETAERTGVPRPRHAEEPHTDELRHTEENVDLQRERFAGTNWGAGIYGWLVAIAITVLLVGVTGALAAAIGREGNLTADTLADNAATTGIAAAIAAVVILALAYFTGGYVAGRMSRFNGAKQGVAVWVVGLVATLVAAAVGVAFGNEYDVMDRIDLPTLSIPTEEVGMGGLVTAAVVLVVTLMAAIAGGKMGRRYHRKVDDLA